MRRSKFRARVFPGQATVECYQRAQDDRDRSRCTEYPQDRTIYCVRITPRPRPRRAHANTHVRTQSETRAITAVSYSAVHGGNNYEQIYQQCPFTRTVTKTYHAIQKFLFSYTASQFDAHLFTRKHSADKLSLCRPKETYLRWHSSQILMFPDG